MSDPVSVTDLMNNFAATCRALIPYLNRACVPWADGRQYDNWDRIAETLFLSLVLEPCRFQAESSFPEIPLILPRYGFPPSDENGWLSLEVGEDTKGQFTQLRSVDGPFDWCEIQVENGRTSRPLATAGFCFVVVSPNGKRHEIRTVTIDL